MNLIERFWMSWAGQLLIRALKKLCPVWYYRNVWQWGAEESAIHDELLEKASHRPNAKLLTEIIQQAHELVSRFLNQEYGGLGLENHVPKMTVRAFSLT